MLRLRINTAKLKEILSQLFESGFYGSAELKDEVVESALAQCEVTEEIFTSGPAGSIEITIGNWIIPASLAPQTGVQSMGMPIGTVAPDGSVGGVMPTLVQATPAPTFGDALVAGQLAEHTYWAETDFLAEWNAPPVLISQQNI